MYSIDVIIPTFKPGSRLIELLDKIENQTVKVNQIIILNTEEKYFRNIDIEKYNNLVVRHIRQQEFDHGGTRHMGSVLSTADIMLFMTQDAMPENELLIENMLLHFEKEGVAAVYARQLPDRDCKEVEKYTRAFNYPNEDRIKSKEDLEELGIKTYFCSNVCAAYRKDVYEALGGFIRRTIFNEDMIYAGRLINAGYKIAYASKARVIHSHNYSCMQQLHRNFDLAVSQKDNPEIFEGVKSESEGIKLVKKSLAHCLKIKKPYLVFDVIMKSGFKYIGYKLGMNYRKLPKGLINRLTMNKSYWN